MSGRYGWWTENRAFIVAHSYGDVACYPNDNGDVVLKQQDDMSDDDPTVIVPIDSAERLAGAILDAAKIGRQILADIQGETSPDPTPTPDQEQQPRLALPSPTPAHPTARPTIVKRGVA
jgi:hypothetical protein